MADIELVIKIPEELKSKIDNANEDNYRTYLWWFETTLYCAIKDGTPLPKGHGDLVDRNDLKYDKYNSYAYAIANAPTIIEADKG